MRFDVSRDVAMTTGSLVRELRLAAVLALACLCAGAWAQSGATETSVKAAYLHKFLPYVEWPDTSLPADESPIVIGVADAEPVRAELERLASGRRVNNHPIETRRVAEGDALDGLHVLYVGRASSLGNWLKHVKQRPILVVSDGATSVDQGGMLSLVPVNGRIRFEASPVAAERSGLKLSARMLTIADRVVTK
jgi:hypothetical protein